MNIHLYQSKLINESRILKISKTLVDNNIVNKCIVIGILGEGLEESEQLDGRRRFWRIRLKYSALRIVALFEWAIRIIMEFRKQEVDMVNCHSLISLPVGVWFKVFKKSKLIYDIHELETETPGMKGARKFVSKIIEKVLIRYVDAVVVAGEFVGTWYCEKYKLKSSKVVVIKNIPYKNNNKIKHSDIFKKKYQIPSKCLVFIYLGMLEEGRGIDLILRVFSKIADKHVVFMGYGKMDKLINEYANKYPNIHLHPAVKLDEIAMYTQGADIGLCLIEEISISYRYCLPNKIFEYINAGIPFIISDLPEMRKYIDNYGFGWKVLTNERDIENLIKKITTDETAYKRINSMRYVGNFSWEEEEKKLVDFYKKNIIVG